MDARDLFEILAREHVRMLLVYIRSQVNECDADDLVQETLIVAWRKIDQFERGKPFGPWLRGIAHHLIMAHFRKRNLIMFDPESLARLENRCDALHELAGDTLDQKLDSLRFCIEQLPEPYRQTVRLRYQDEISGEVLALSLIHI